MIEKELTIVNLFGGIGAFDKALEKLGVNTKIVDYVDKDVYATNAYNSMYGTDFVPTNIENYEPSIKNPTFMTISSPCEWASNGKFVKSKKSTKTQLNYLTKIVEIVKKVKPKILFFENVDSIENKNNCDEYALFIHNLNCLGYKLNSVKLCATDFNLPQSRTRVLLYGYHKESDITLPLNKFPMPVKLETSILDFLEKDVEPYYYLDTIDLIGTKKYNLCQKLLSSGLLKEGYIINHSYTGNVDDNNLSKHILSTNHIMPTLTTRCDIYGVVVRDRFGNLRIRKLTPKECWRLQGYDDTDFEKAKKTVQRMRDNDVLDNDIILYRMAGNSIPINMLVSFIQVALPSYCASVIQPQQINNKRVKKNLFKLFWKNSTIVVGGKNVEIKERAS